jgi:hypothetical protein
MQRDLVTVAAMKSLPLHTDKKTIKFKVTTNMNKCVTYTADLLIHQMILLYVAEAIYFNAHEWQKTLKFF